MNWPPLDVGSAFLILSVVAGVAAAALLIQAAARSRSRTGTYLDPTGAIQLYHENSGNGQGLSLLDRVTLLNRNLTQCLNCHSIDHASARFCIRCGMPMQPQIEPVRGNIRDVEARYLVRDGSNQMLGLSIGLDSDTRLGVLIGLQKRERTVSINEDQD